MIVIDDLKKKFGDLKVLNGIDLSIDDGLIYGIVGESGQGKSTLLRCVNGLINYDAGSLKVDDIEISSQRESDLRRFRKNVGMIFQTYSLLERSDVFDNVAFPMRIWKIDEATVKKQVHSMLEIVGLTEKVHNYPRELSGGQKQRVAIARSLVMNPRYILSDESTSALDPKTSGAILELLKRINKEFGITVLVVAHQMEVIRRTCDRMAILRKGKISLDDTVKNMFLKQPEDLRKLMGEDEETKEPGRKKMRVYIPGKGNYNEFFYKLGHEAKVRFRFESGGVNTFKEGDAFLGTLSVEDRALEEAAGFFTRENVDYEVMQNGI